MKKTAQNTVKHERQNQNPAQTCKRSKKTKKKQQKHERNVQIQLKPRGNELDLGVFSRVLQCFMLGFSNACRFELDFDFVSRVFTVFCVVFSHFLEVLAGFWVFLFILRRVFAVFDRLKSAALSPNLFREVV